jgi:hypothetical protein
LESIEGSRIEHERVSRLPQLELWGQESGRTMTYVPGFWSWKGLSSTVRTLMMDDMLQAGMGAIEAIGVIKEWVERR